MRRMIYTIYIMLSPHPVKANFIPGDRISLITHQGKQILLVDMRIVPRWRSKRSCEHFPKL